MPLYEYQCRECGSQFEELVFNREVAVVCKKCGSDKISQLISTFAVAGGSERAQEPGPCGSCGAAQRGMCGMAN